MTRTLTIDGVDISDETPAYVIAEIGHNHGGDLDQAMHLFDEARRAGAHAVKLQKRDNRSLYTREAFDKPYENENSYGATYGEHREALEFGRAEYEALIEYAQRIGVTFFATAFDMPSAAFLADLDMPAYKIASADLRNIPLVRHVASFGKPMVLSTGASTLEDVKRAHAAVAEINPEIALLQCTAGYPAAWDELDLGVIPTFRELFPDTVIGLSSHDNGIAMAVAAHALGARVIEKHFTLDRVLKGTDHRFSLEPQGLRKMCRDLSRLHVAMGDGNKKIYESEAGPTIKMAKKLVAARDLPAGHVLEAEDVAMKSPGDGLAPFELDNVLGRRLTRPLLADESLRFEVLEEPSEEALAAAAAPDAG
ncbi:MAG: sialic acid synthase [Solirubrobacteraceae bacterium]|nr:sialic acid synthase [Solirubrobacteraceae bacterium]